MTSKEMLIAEIMANRSNLTTTHCSNCGHCTSAL